MRSQNNSIYCRADTLIAVFLFAYLASHGDISFFGISADASAIQNVNILAVRVVRLLFEFFSLAIILKHSPNLLIWVQRHPLILVYPLVAIASLFWSQDPWQSFPVLIDLLLTTLLAFALIAEYKPQDLLSVLELSGFFVVVVGLLLFVLMPSVGKDQYADIGALQGFFLGKNPCAMQTIFLMSPTFFIQNKKSMAQKAFRFIYVLLGIVSVLLTRSRTGIILLIFMILFIVVLKMLGRIKKTDVFFIIVPLCLASVFLIVGALQNYSAVFHLIGRDASMTGRTEIWSALWDSIKKHPFIGYGYGAFWTGMHGESMNVIAAMRWVFSYAHNGYLEVWLQLGFLGLAVIVAQILISLKNGIIAFHRAPKPEVMWSIVIIVMSVLYNCDESFLGANKQLPWMLFIVASIYLAKEAQRKISFSAEA